MFYKVVQDTRTFLDLQDTSHIPPYRRREIYQTLGESFFPSDIDARIEKLYQYKPYTPQTIYDEFQFNLARIIFNKISCIFLESSDEDFRNFAVEAYKILISLNEFDGDSIELYEYMFNDMYFRVCAMSYYANRSEYYALCAMDSMLSTCVGFKAFERSIVEISTSDQEIPIGNQDFSYIAMLATCLEIYDPIKQEHFLNQEKCHAYWLWWIDEAVHKAYAAIGDCTP
jgi:hypothetical protein